VPSIRLGDIIAVSFASKVFVCVKFEFFKRELREFLIREIDGGLIDFNAVHKIANRGAEQLPDILPSYSPTLVRAAACSLTGIPALLWYYHLPIPLEGVILLIATPTGEGIFKLNGFASSLYPNTDPLLSYLHAILGNAQRAALLLTYDGSFDKLLIGQTEIDLLLQLTALDGVGLSDLLYNEVSGLSGCLVNGADQGFILNIFLKMLELIYSFGEAFYIELDHNTHPITVTIPMMAQTNITYNPTASNSHDDQW